MNKRQVDFLKVVALLAMVVDHVGVYLLPEILSLRIVGRLAFPLFAFALVQGFLHTSDFSMYSRRVLFLALAWQVLYSFFYLMGYFPKSEPLNFVFILYIGLIILDMLRDKKFVCVIVILLVIFLFDVIGFSIPYGSYGLILIVLIYFFYYDLLFLSFCLFVLSFGYVYFGFHGVIQVFAPFSLLFVFFRFSLFKVPSFFFYFMYPFHLAVIFGLRACNAV